MKKVLRWSGKLCLLLLILLVVYQAWIFAHIAWWRWFNPSASAFMEDRLEIMQEANPEATLRHQWVQYDKISPHLKRALIAAEDSHFLEHEGEILRAHLGLGHVHGVRTEE